MEARHRRLREMGKLIEQLAPEYGFTLRSSWTSSTMRRRRYHAGELRGRRRGDRVLAFRTRSLGISRGSRRWACRLVVGTTGWLEHMDRVQAAVEKNGTGLVWSPNFSIGVNVFFRAGCAKPRDCWRTSRSTERGPGRFITTTKKDAPSGTLLKLVEEMKKAGYARNIDVSSNRAGRASRDARDRLRFGGGYHHAAAYGAQPRRFARGALKAAQWIVGQERCVTSSARFCLQVREVTYVYRMRHSAGHSVPAGSVAR